MSGSSQYRAGGGRIDDLCTVLAHERCRSVLYYFQSSEKDVATVAELVEYAARTSPGGETGRAEVRLHHTTLPRLAEANVIEYDPRGRTVRYRGHPLLEEMLDLISQAKVAP